MDARPSGLATRELVLVALFLILAFIVLVSSPSFFVVKMCAAVEQAKEKHEQTAFTFQMVRKCT